MHNLCKNMNKMLDELQELKKQKEHIIVRLEKEKTKKIQEFDDELRIEKDSLIELKKYKKQNV